MLTLDCRVYSKDGTLFFVPLQESVDFAARIERMLRLSLGVDLTAEVYRFKDG